MSLILATREDEICWTAVQGQPKQIVHETPPISKLTRAKSTGGVPQVVKCLLCKHEAQFKPVPPKKKKKKKRKGKK
jgi:hypothetical protein